MSENKVEFKILDAKLVGSDTVTFKLEDGTLVRIKIDINRAGIAVNYKNPDGSPHYNIGINSQVTFVPQDKKFFIPKSQISQQLSPPKDVAMKPV
jgi:hypothetical protein